MSHYQLKILIKLFYAEQFTDGNIQNAEAEIDERLEGIVKIKEIFISYVCLGMILAIILALPIIYFIPESKDNITF